MAKAKKDKVIPKRVAGVKIPKALRKAANNAIERLAEYPAISDLVASGLIAAAATLTEGQTPKKRAETPSKDADVAAGKAAPAPPGKTAKGKGDGGNSPPGPDVPKESKLSAERP